MILAFLVACGGPEARLPAGGGELSPSYATYRGPSERLANTTDCATCHTTEHAAWGRSAHKHASLDNPWYLASFRAVRDDVGVTASRHCAGCHDPVLLAAGALEGSVGPETADADAGVTCLTCHGIVSATLDGNGSYVVDVSALPDPTTDVEAHRARMLSPSLRDGTACAACHRGFLTPQTGNPHVVVGMDDWGAWAGSAWAGPNTRRVEPEGRKATCIACHLGDHQMTGGRSSITGSAAVTARMENVVQVSLPVAEVDGVYTVLDGAFAPPAGSEVVLHVTVRNMGVGHRFPGGLADLQDTWVDLELGGRSVRAIGLRALALNETGDAELAHHAHRVAVAAFDHTIPPGEAVVARVRFVAPGGALHPTAVVRHRPHRAELAAAACANTSASTLDGCAPAAVVEVARGTLGGGDAGVYAHALGVSRGRSEDLGLALRSLDVLGKTARAEGLRARVLGRQGRVGDALAAAASSEALGGPHPALERTRGDVYAQVWRWSEAAVAYARVADQSPNDPTVWRDLAGARGGAGDAAGSLQAALRGLQLLPRDADLLRHQALALRALESPSAESSLEAWLSHRVPDEANGLRLRCDLQVAECSERAPVPLVDLR